MSIYQTYKNNFSSQPLRAGMLALLMLCLLISCPVKKELKSILLGGAPVESSSAAHQPVKSEGAVFQASGAEACLQACRTILKEMQAASFLQQLDLKNPLLFLAFTLASLYLLLAAAGGQSLLHNSFAGEALAAKIPLFLRHRQLII
jgi:hypothetical protein